jgi:hypothetical protein
LLWCVFVFAACWCASAAAGPPSFPGSTVDQPVASSAAPPRAIPTILATANSQSASSDAMGGNRVAVHAIPTLDGFGLFILAALLGLAVFWLWRRRQ